MHAQRERVAGGDVRRGRPHTHAQAADVESAADTHACTCTLTWLPRRAIESCDGAASTIGWTTLPRGVV